MASSTPEDAGRSHENAEHGGSTSFSHGGLSAAGGGTPSEPYSPRSLADQIERWAPYVAEEVAQEYFLQRPYEGKSSPAVQQEHLVREVELALRYLSNTVAFDVAELFGDHIAWMRTGTQPGKAAVEALALQLQCIRDVLLRRFKGEAAQIIGAQLATGAKRLGDAAREARSWLDSADNVMPEARGYLEAILRADRQAARAIVFGSLDKGATVGQLYLQLFQPVQREAGRLWRQGQIGMAQEHYCSEVSRAFITLLNARVPGSGHAGRVYLGACVSSEPHEIGGRIVSAFFDMAGWDSIYMGTGLPDENLLQFLRTRRVDVLGLSATMTYHLRHLASLIQSIRENLRGEPLRILVGGFPFNRVPKLWSQVGADGTAASGRDAVAIASSLSGTATAG